VPRVGTLLATRSATLPGAPRSPVHQLNMTVLRSPPSPSDLPAPLTTVVAAVLHRAVGRVPSRSSGTRLRACTTWASRRSGPATPPLRPRLAAPVEVDGPAPDRRHEERRAASVRAPDMNALAERLAGVLRRASIHPSVAPGSSGRGAAAGGASFRSREFAFSRVHQLEQLARLPRTVSAGLRRRREDLRPRECRAASFAACLERPRSWVAVASVTMG
jgi:hypothetical protein